MDEHRQDDHHEATYSSPVPIQKQWTIGRGSDRESGISVLIARHDDDDDNDECNLIFIIIYNINICLYTVKWLQVLLFNTNFSIQYYSFIYTCEMVSSFAA